MNIQRSIAVMLYSGSIRRKSFIIMTNPVIVKQQDILLRYEQYISCWNKHWMKQFDE